MSFGFMKAFGIVHALIAAALVYTDGGNSTFHDGFDMAGRAVTVDATFSKGTPGDTPTTAKPVIPEYDPFMPVNGPDFLGYDPNKPLNVPPSANQAQAPAPPPVTGEAATHAFASELYGFLASANIGDPATLYFTLGGVRVDVTLSVN